MRELHGGNVYKHNIKIDFSSNINPFGPPPSVVEFLRSPDFLETLKRYPRLYPERLLKKLSHFTGVDAECIAVGPGSSFFVYALLSLFRGKRILIPFPTFVEYERAASFWGCPIKLHALREDTEFRVDMGALFDASWDVDIVFLCNPNNPTGFFVEKDELVEFLRWAEKKGKVVFVDEAYVEFVENYEPIPPMGQVVFLRSFTKAYGIPGVRLGYVYGSKALVQKVKSITPPWPIGGGWEEIGILCLEDRNFLESSRDKIRRVKKFLQEELPKVGFKVFPSAANFLLLKSSWNPYYFLLERGILIRGCVSFRGLGPDFFRISVRGFEDSKTLLLHLREGYEKYAHKHESS